MDEAIAKDQGITRRGLFTKAAIGLAAAAGLTAALQHKVLGRTVAVPTLTLPEDSIFTPRAEQRKQVLGE